MTSPDDHNDQPVPPLPLPSAPPLPPPATPPLLLERLTLAWRELSATRSRNAKRDIMAGVFADTGATEVEIVASYLSGSLRQRRTGIGWRTVQQVPSPAEQPSLTVAEVDQAFARTAELSGPGSVSQRQAEVAALFSRATAEEQQLLRGLIFGELRQGALESAVQDGLAAAYDVPKAAVRRAAMLLGSTAAMARALVEGGLPALEAVTLQVGTAVQPMLAASAPDVLQALDKRGMPVVVDAKLDGVRVQVHKHGAEVAVYSRSLDDITDRLPSVVQAIAALPDDQLVLDGEALALRPDGSPEAFQEIASSVATRSEPVAGQVALRGYFFDLLRIGDRDLLDHPLSERIKIISEALPEELLVPRIIAEQEEAATAFYADVVGRGFEGVVIKNPEAPYAAGRRDSAWIKVKPRHTLDLVVIAVERGHGRRQGTLSNLHLAARDEHSGEMIMLGKTFKGLTDELLRWQTERFTELQTADDGWVVTVRPEQVVEIAFDGVQRSPRYPGGVALRFARVLRYRDDKRAEQADTIQAVQRLLTG